MERYSRLCQISRSGQSRHTRELVRSGELDTFLRQLGIMNLQAGYDAVEQSLADFRKLSDLDSLPPDARPMLIRYSPIELAGQPGWARDVVPFLALCATGTDSRGELRHHTYFFRSGLLRRAGEFHYLDHLFGTRFAVMSPENADPDLPPVRVEPVLRPEDAALVKLAAAAVLKKRCILLKLEKNCDFNRRAMELLAQIYSLLPPELAIQTGFSSYQDPHQLEKLMRSTAIRIFLTHADCGCSPSDPEYLYFDLNQPLNLQLAAQQAKDFQVSKALLTYLTYWHSMPWWERQPLMELLFAEEKHLPNEQTFCAITHSFVREPFVQWINRIPDRGTIASLAELKEKYDSFPICERVPVLRKKFRMAVPELLKPSLTLEALADEVRSRLADCAPEDQEQLKALSGFAQMLLSIRPMTDAPKAQTEPPKPRASAPKQTDTPSQGASAGQLRELERSFQEKLAQLSQENQTLRQTHAEQLRKLEQAFSEKLSQFTREKEALSRTGTEQRQTETELREYIDLLTKENETLKSSLRSQTTSEEEQTRLCREAEQTFQAKLSRLSQENQTLRQTHAQALQSMEQTFAEQLAARKQEMELLRKEHAEQLRKAEEEFREFLDLFTQEQETALKEATSGMVPAESLAAAQARNQELEQSYTAQLAALKEDHASVLAEKAEELAKLDRSRTDLMETYTIVRNNFEALQKELFRKNQEQEAALGQLQQAHEAKLEALTREHAEFRAKTEQELIRHRQAQASMYDELLSIRKERDAALKRLTEQNQEKERLEQEHASDLSRIQLEHTEQLKRLRSDTDAAEARAHQLENQIAQLSRAQAESLERIEQDLRLEFEITLSDQLDALEKQHTEELARQQAAFTETEEALLRDIQALTHDRDTFAAQLEQTHAEELKKLEQEHAAQLMQLRVDHSAQTRKLRSDTDAAEARAHQLETRIAQLSRAQTEILERTEQDLRLEFEMTLSDQLDALEKQHADELTRQQAAFTETEEALLRNIQALSNDRDTLAAQLKQTHADELEKLEQEHAADLSRLRTEHTEQIKRLRSDTDAAEARALQLETKVAQLTRLHDESLTQAQRDLRSEFEQTLTDERELLAKQHADELARQQAAFTETEEALLRNIQALTNDRDTFAAQLKQTHADELEKLEQEHAAELVRLRMEHTEQTKRLRSDTDAAEARALQLETKVAQLTRAQADAREKAEQDLRSEFEQTLADERELLAKQHADELTRQQAAAQETEKALRLDLDTQAAQMKELEVRHSADLQLHLDSVRTAKAEALELQEQLTQASQALEAERQRHMQFRADLKQQFNENCEKIRAAAMERIQFLEKELAEARTGAPKAGASSSDAQLRAALEQERARHQDALAQLNKELAAKTEAAVRDARLKAAQEAEALFLQDREQLVQDHEQQTAALRAHLDNLEKKHKEEIQQINSVNTRIRQELERRHKEEIEQINATNTTARQNLDEERKNEICQINANNAVARQTLEQKYRAEIEQINANNASARKALEEQHAADKQKLQAEVMGTVTQYWEQLKDANRRIRELEDALEAARKTPGNSKPNSWWRK